MTGKKNPTRNTPAPAGGDAVVRTLEEEIALGLIGPRARLVEVIENLAMKAHAIRSYSIGNPATLEAVCIEHGEMIALLQRCDRTRLVALVGQHIHPAKEAYLQLARHVNRPSLQSREATTA